MRKADQWRNLWVIQRTANKWCNKIRKTAQAGKCGKKWGKLKEIDIEESGSKSWTETTDCKKIFKQYTYILF